MGIFSWLGGSKPEPRLERLPVERHAFNALITQRLRGVLAPLGFVERPNDIGASEFDLVRGEVTMRVYALGVGGAAPVAADVSLSVRHASIERLVGPFRPLPYPWNASIGLARRRGLRHFPLYEPAELDALEAAVRADLPPLVQDCSTIVGLDRVVNGDQTDVLPDAYTELSSIAMAYLAGNPNYMHLVAASAERSPKSADDPLGLTRRFADHLEREAPPPSR